MKIELDEARNSLELAEEQAEQSRTSYNVSIDAEKSKLEEAEAKFNMQLVSLTENLSYNKTDLTATQEKLMDVVKHNDELRGFNLGMLYHSDVPVASADFFCVTALVYPIS